MISWSYGRRTVLEILSSGSPVEKVLISKRADPGSVNEILALAREKRIPCEWVDLGVLNSVAPGNHQGVAVRVEAEGPVDFKSFLRSLAGDKKKFVCLLDEVQDPQNLGAVIRSAVFFGCSGIILPGRRSARVTQSVLKSSSGAAAHIPAVEVSNLTVAIERLKEQGFFVYGADASATGSLEAAELDFPLALVLGNEHSGIKPILRKACDGLLAIPQGGPVASLNVSNAAAIFFYEISKRLRQLGQPL